MTHSVTLSDQTTFSVRKHETILAAAERQNLNLPHSCKSGFCGQCKAELISGKAVMKEHSGKALTQEEEAQGKILMCCATLESNSEINIPNYSGHETLPVRTLPARVSSITFKHDVAILKLTLPKAPTFVFQAGQYINLLLPGNISRSYSLANSPADNNMIELHIRKRTNGICSNMIFSDMPSVKPQSIVRFKGPLGTFPTLSKPNRPLILLATGTGYAPIRSMLLKLIRLNTNREVHFYWGARKADDLYAPEEAAELISRLQNSTFTPVLSQPDHNWNGLRGYVQHAAAQDHTDMSGYDVYACGSEKMITAAQDFLCQQCSLNQDAFSSDIFNAAPPE
ncbi:FAD-binding oxidoreductase [Neisseria animalis]|uniref:CDP-6-deoxy-delta-3,4-glucoseen reductase n=1 Tax=Neisseria animalis TaxID=492 RepID=A0A5P3MU97_NEIAN|nr:FAD-binding oxidoreductase [Neisseria animalis]QEY24341.1 CDP-6-deoxy-delta-3,4-glucoseen reductase [Neisseria animalis]ROW31752.1 CDP-6-deoxy-delta-3,4-glucoseen reductase [Neisseria animalis]VEE06824.1 iron/sulfur-binding oxidoreductase [Neisseria animalis]